MSAKITKEPGHCTGGIVVVTVGENGAAICEFMHGGKLQKLDIPGNATTTIDVDDGTAVKVSGKGNPGYVVKDKPFFSWLSDGESTRQMAFDFVEGETEPDKDFEKKPAGSAHDELMAELGEVKRMLGIIMKNTCPDGSCVLTDRG